VLAVINYINAHQSVSASAEGEAVDSANERIPAAAWTSLGTGELVASASCGILCVVPAPFRHSPELLRIKPCPKLDLGIRSFDSEQSHASRAAPTLDLALDQDSEAIEDLWDSLDKIEWDLAADVAAAWRS